MINGVQQELTFTNQPTGSIIDNEGIDLKIGGTGNEVSKTFDGDIDEVRVWRIARAASDIALSMSDTLLGSEPNLVGYWQMDEGSGLYIYDGTAYCNKGECFNAQWVVGFEIGVSAEKYVQWEPFPTEFGLARNYPNPFSRSTHIPFSVPKHADVRIAVYDLYGKLVTTLVDEPLIPGYHKTTWEGTNLKKGDVPSGLYICRMKSGAFNKTRRMLLLR